MGLGGNENAAGLPAAGAALDDAALLEVGEECTEALVAQVQSGTELLAGGDAAGGGDGGGDGGEQALGGA